MRSRLRALLAEGNRSNFILSSDVAITSLTNAGMLIAGVRVVSPADATKLTLFQLIVVTAVQFQRALVLNPALAAQRVVGAPSRVPLTWIPLVSLPVGVAIGVGTDLAVPGASSSETLSLAVWACVTLLALDVVRFNHFSVGTASRALEIDLIWLGVTAVGILSALRDQTWVSVLVWWCAGATVALLVGVAVRRRSPDRDAIRLRQALRLGKWSGADVGMSAIASVLPMLVSAVALQSSLGAVYRVLQTVLGPLNILSSAMLTIFGLDSWKLTTEPSLVQLRQRAVRLCLLMTGLVTAIVALGIPLTLFLSKIPIGTSLVPALIVAVTGIVGAATIPFSASASSLGYQRFGLYIRLAIVATALIVSVLSQAGAGTLRVSDPIGIVMVASAGFSLVGWLVGFRWALRTELRQIRSHT